MFHVDVITACLIASSGMIGAALSRWMLRDPTDHSERVEKLEKAVVKLRAEKKKVVKPQSSGPYRTPDDPNQTSPLPEPTPATTAVTVIDWDDDLHCPVCNASNRWLHAKDNKTKSINKNTHTSCVGCSANPTPHLHVDCWNCKFKYVSKAASEVEPDYEEEEYDDESDDE